MFINLNETPSEGNLQTWVYRSPSMGWVLLMSLGGVLHASIHFSFLILFTIYALLFSTTLTSSKHAQLCHPIDAFVTHTHTLSECELG